MENLEAAADKNNISYVDEDNDNAYNSQQISHEPTAMGRKMSVPKTSARTRTAQGTFQKHKASFVSQKSAAELQNEIETTKSIVALKEQVEDQSFIEENKAQNSPSSQERKNNDSYQNYVDAENVQKSI